MFLQLLHRCARRTGRAAIRPPSVAISAPPCARPALASKPRNGAKDGIDRVGVRGIRLEDPGDVEAGVAAALAHDGPVLVDAVVNRTELAMPPAVTTEMAKGFTLYMVKAVMSGRGDELIDLARTNLWR